MGSDNQRLIAALTRLVDPARSDKLRRILNVGSGRCSECLTLLDSFPAAHLTLVDHDPDVVGFVRLMLEEWQNRVQIVHHDAAGFLSNHSDLYDLVVVRHPDIDQNKIKWREILDGAWSCLRTSGYLLASCYTLEEARFIGDCMSRKSAVHQAITHMELGAVPLTGRDRYIQMYTKTF